MKSETLILALVAIVAIMALVFTQNGSVTGAAVCSPGEVALYAPFSGNLVCTDQAQAEAAHQAWERPLGRHGGYGETFQLRPFYREPFSTKKPVN